jgi:hypothetical protein
VMGECLGVDLSKVGNSTAPAPAPSSTAPGT